MRRLGAAGLLVAVSVLGAATITTKAADPPATFARDVLPILQILIGEPPLKY